MKKHEERGFTRWHSTQSRELKEVELELEKLQFPPHSMK